MRQSNAQPKISPKAASLAQTLNDLLRHQKSGAALPECYGDDIGAEHWAAFVRQSDPSVQYTFQSEVSAIQANAPAIAALIAKDADIDPSALIVMEKGGGSKEALRAKSFRLMEAFREASMGLAAYANLEHSENYREESLAEARAWWPQAQAMAFDLDFNADEPDLTGDLDGPRIVMELGSSRGNIPVSKLDKKSFAEQTYAELQRRFAHDRKLCRDGGLLIVGSDANQGTSTRAAYVHPAHSDFAENIIGRGAREGVLSKTFDPKLLRYDPVWDQKNHVVRHTLVAHANQNFEMMSPTGGFNPARIYKGEHFVLSHSIKWPEKKMIAAAESQGFKCLGVFWGPDHRVPVYVFKAKPAATRPALKIVS